MFFILNLPIFPGCSTRIVGNFVDPVVTTGFDKSGNAVETMDAAREYPVLLSEDIP